jgi:hypothetical protein
MDTVQGGHPKMLELMLSKEPLIIMHIVMSNKQIMHSFGPNIISVEV